MGTHCLGATGRSCKYYTSIQSARRPEGHESQRPDLLTEGQLYVHVEGVDGVSTIWVRYVGAWVDVQWYHTTIRISFIRGGYTQCR